MSRKALGRGLGALIPGGETSGAPTMENPNTVPLSQIRPNPYQPRTVFDPEPLADLCRSIKETGLIQPLVVRKVAENEYELIAGERRFLASKEAGLTNVPVVIREATRREMLELAMIENLQREDLNPMEEAEAYQRLATEFGMTQEEIAKRVGKSRSTVTNSLRLLSLPEDIKGHVSRGGLSSGHARAILGLPDESSRRELAKEILEQGLTVRQVEQKAQGTGRHRGKPAAKGRAHPAMEAYEERLRNRFGTQVRIVGGTGRGRIELHYFNEEDLERVLTLAGISTQL